VRLVGKPNKDVGVSLIRGLNIILLVLFVGSGVFGYWGLFTETGRNDYDEMAGIIPFWSLCISLISISLVVIINVSRFVLRQRRKDRT